MSELSSDFETQRATYYHDQDHLRPKGQDMVDVVTGMFKEDDRPDANVIDITGRIPRLPEPVDPADGFFDLQKFYDDEAIRMANIPSQRKVRAAAHPVNVEGRPWQQGVANVVWALHKAVTQRQNRR